MGNSPERLFEKIHNILKLGISQIEFGIVPDSILKDKFNSFKLFKFPIASGIVPEIWFINRSNTSKCFNSVNSTGNVPTRLFLERLIPTTWSFWILIPCHEEIGAFKSHFTIHWLPFVL